ncbi:uncharacterized protein LOC144359192 [Saccoglossus kowalevskii]
MWEDVNSSDSLDTVVDSKENRHEFCAPVSVHKVPSGTMLCGPVCVLRIPSDTVPAGSKDSLLHSEKQTYERLRKNKSRDVKFDHHESWMSDPFMQAVKEVDVADMIIKRAKEAKERASVALRYAKKACSAANAAVDVARYVAKCARVTAQVAIEMTNHASLEEAFFQARGRSKLSYDQFRAVLAFPESNDSFAELLISDGSNDDLPSSKGPGHLRDSDSDDEELLNGTHSGYLIGPNVSQKVRMWEDKSTNQLPVKVAKSALASGNTTTCSKPIDIDVPMQRKMSEPMSGSSFLLLSYLCEDGHFTSRQSFVSEFVLVITAGYLFPSPAF